MSHTSATPRVQPRHNCHGSEWTSSSPIERMVLRPQSMARAASGEPVTRAPMSSLNCSMYWNVWPPTIPAPATSASRWDLLGRCPLAELALSQTQQLKTLVPNAMPSARCPITLRNKTFPHHSVTPVRTPTAGSSQELLSANKDPLDWAGVWSVEGGERAERDPAGQQHR